MCISYSANWSTLVFQFYLENKYTCWKVQCAKNITALNWSLWRLNLKRYNLHLPQGHLRFNIRLEELFWMAMFSIHLDLHTQCSSGAKFFLTPTAENTYCLPAFPSASNFETEIKKKEFGRYALLWKRKIFPLQKISPYSHSWVHCFCLDTYVKNLQDLLLKGLGKFFGRS